MISRCIALIDQPDATNRRDNQSSKSRLTGRSPSRPEVIGRADQAFAEVPEPEAIDHHPGGQGVVAPGQPCRQFEPAAPARFERWLVFTGQDPGKAARHFLAQRQMIAANMDSQVRDRLVLDAHHFGDRRRLLLQLGQCIAQAAQVLFRLRHPPYRPAF